MEAKSEQDIIQGARDAPFEVLEVYPVGEKLQDCYEERFREVLQDTSITTFEELNDALFKRFHDPYSDGAFFFSCYKASDARKELRKTYGNFDLGHNGYVKLGDLMIKCVLQCNDEDG